jgi:hypothetical protein
LKITAPSVEALSSSGADRERARSVVQAAFAKATDDASARSAED